MFQYFKFNGEEGNDSGVSELNLNVSLANKMPVSHQDKLKAILSSKPIHVSKTDDICCLYSQSYCFIILKIS